MFKILITDDDFEDRELLKMEIKRALEPEDADLRFYEAVSVREAKNHLNFQFFDLMTLDIQFDRMNEGIDALPELFENYPALNIIVISGRLNKSEVSEKLFRFTKDNVLKGKRWIRHFDVLDKKDDKTEALRSAYSFALKEAEVSGRLRELFLLAESYMEKDMVDKCLDIYRKIQRLAPGEHESNENIHILKNTVSIEQALKYMDKGDKVAASLLLGHYIETKLKTFTARILGRTFSGLFECLTELTRSSQINKFHLDLFHEAMRRRNKAIHHPTDISRKDFHAAEKKIKLLEKNSNEN